MELKSDVTMDQNNFMQSYGSISRRFVALILDAIILVIPVAIAAGILPIVGGVIVWFFYGPILESSSIRATVGKHMMGLQVADLSGRRITLKSAVIRNVMKLVSGSVFAIGFLFAFFTGRKQTLHDLLSDTVVVYGRSEEPIMDSWIENSKAVFRTASDASEHLIAKVAPRTIDQLERLQALREKGALTEEEFQEAKRKVLAGESKSSL